MKTEKYIEQYLDSLRERRLSANTVTTRQRSLRKLTRWLNARNYSLADLVEEDIRDFQKYLQSTLKAASVRTHLSAAQNFCNFLEKQALILENPFSDFGELPKVDLLPVVLSEEEYINLIKRLPTCHKVSKRNIALLELAYSSLLRREELVNLKIADINFDHQILRVIRKGDKEALVPFGEQAKKTLLDYLNTERQKLLRGQSSQSLWINHKGDELEYGDMDGILRQIQDTTGIKIDFHTLRRSGATHMLKHGAPLLMIQQMLSHTSLQTVKHYLRLDVKDLRNTHKKAGGLQ